MAVVVHKDIVGVVRDDAIRSGVPVAFQHLANPVQDMAFMAGWRGRRAAQQVVCHDVTMIVDGDAVDYFAEINNGTLTHQLQWVTGPEVRYVAWEIDYYTDWAGSGSLRPTIAVSVINRATGAAIDAGYTVDYVEHGLRSGFFSTVVHGAGDLIVGPETRQGYFTVDSALMPLDNTAPAAALRPFDLTTSPNLDVCFQAVCTNLIPTLLTVYELYESGLG